MVAQDDGLFVANAFEQSRRFISVDGDAFKVMVRNHVVKLRGVKIGLLQTFFQAGHRHTCRGVCVHHTMRLWQVVVQSRVHRKTSRVHWIGRAIEYLAFQVNFDQIAGGDFAVVQTKGVDQEMFFGATDLLRQAQGDVVVNHFGPA